MSICFVFLLAIIKTKSKWYIYAVFVLFPFYTYYNYIAYVLLKKKYKMAIYAFFVISDGLMLACSSGTKQHKKYVHTYKSGCERAKEKSNNTCELEFIYRVNHVTVHMKLLSHWTSS